MTKKSSPYVRSDWDQTAWSDCNSLDMSSESSSRAGEQAAASGRSEAASSPRSLSDGSDSTQSSARLGSMGPSSNGRVEKLLADAKMKIVALESKLERLNLENQDLKLEDRGLRSRVEELKFENADLKLANEQLEFSFVASDLKNADLMGETVDLLVKNVALSKTCQGLEDSKQQLTMALGRKNEELIELNKQNGLASANLSAIASGSKSLETTREECARAELEYSAAQKRKAAKDAELATEVAAEKACLMKLAAVRQKLNKGEEAAKAAARDFQQTTFADRFNTANFGT